MALIEPEQQLKDHQIDPKKTVRKNIRENSLPKLNFKCSIENCNAAYRKKCLLDDHIRKHNKERPFICSVSGCTKSFTKEPHLKRHKVMVHEKACELACDVEGCGKIFNNKYSLKKHKTKVHTENKFPFVCNECQKGFNKKWKLNQHMFIHTGEPPFKCNICNVGFTLPRDLSKHMRNHKTYSCDCGEIFEKWSLLLRHKTNICEHIVKKCKNCGTTFTKKGDLRSHYKVCKKNESYQCPYLNCTRTYMHKRNLNWHINQIHEKDKLEENTFECTEKKCGKVFSNKYYLQRHVRAMHVEHVKEIKPRAPRKDKGIKKTSIAATLSGVTLQKEPKKSLTNDEVVVNVPNTPLS